MNDDDKNRIIKEICDLIGIQMILWGSDDIFDTLNPTEKWLANLFQTLHPD